MTEAQITDFVRAIAALPEADQDDVGDCLACFSLANSEEDIVETIKTLVEIFEQRPVTVERII